MRELTLEDMKRFTFYGIEFIDSSCDEIFNKDKDNDDLSFKIKCDYYINEE